MVAESKGPLDFPAFLNLFETKLNGTDDEAILVAAFKLFDAAGAGSIASDV